MNRVIVILFLVLFASATCSAQTGLNKSGMRGTQFNIDKLYFAGGGGLGSGTNTQGYRYNYYSLLPTVGYKVQPNFLLGVNLSYSRYSFPDVGVHYDQFGYAPFARYVVQQLFFQVEYDRISSSTIDNQPRRYYDRFLVGAGYTQPLGKRGSINAMAMYDLLYQPNGVFNSPIVFRVFFGF
ncbi:hypothetical protein WSM22_13300 [Cytophagales bacterium WSM2-2]|nr:hypothetical protein WSM22_13300 [Cytophagales bacterium WSM2-2]